MHPININEKFQLEKGWTLRSNHKYGQRGSGKRITSKVRTYLEGFFLGGNVSKTDRMSAKDMMVELKKLMEEGEIQEEEVPEIKTIEGWITRYSATLRRESAEKRVAENNKSSIGFENDGGSAHEKQKRQKIKNSGK
ncbi:3989_t:CDS:2 [Entrophospora sp. SA101]|nr:3989_t:CDS:2 [Entrophospora sp. SA101]